MAQDDANRVEEIDSNLSPTKNFTKTRNDNVRKLHRDYPLFSYTFSKSYASGHDNLDGFLNIPKHLIKALLCIGRTLVSLADLLRNFGVFIIGKESNVKIAMANLFLDIGLGLKNIIGIFESLASFVFRSGLSLVNGYKQEEQTNHFNHTGEDDTSAVNELPLYLYP